MINREERKREITEYIKTRVRDNRKIGGYGVDDVVEWLLDYMNVNAMSDSLSEARELDKANDKVMRKLWIDAYVAGSGNYDHPNHAKTGADMAIKAYDETFNLNRKV